LLRMRAAEQEARRINRNLEELVVERTRDLADINQRLADEITDRRQAEAALWHTQKLDLIGQLTGGIAHDFNNLLMVISGNLELLHEAFDGGVKLSPRSCGSCLATPRPPPSMPPKSRSSFSPSRGAAPLRRRPSASKIC